MSDINQFFGGGAPIGTLQPIVDSASPLYAINGQAWLRTGVLAPIAGYTGLETTNPYMTVNAAAIVGVNNSHNSSRGMWYTNGHYYSSDNAGNGAYSTTLATWSATAYSIPNGDTFVMGNYLIGIDAATSGYYQLAASGGGFVNGTGMVCGASNPAGTLGVICKNAGSAASNIYTSTNATSWASQTPSGGSSGAINRVAWNIFGSKFIYLTLNGNAFTTSNGYTLTSGGSTGLSAIQVTPATNGVPADHGASSPTSTMFTCVGTASSTGVVGLYLLKTADGLAFTTTLLSALLGLDSRQQVAQPPKITYSNGIWMLILAPLSGDQATSLCYKSTDDGVTWVKMPIPINASYPTTVLSVFKYLNNQYVSAVVSVTLKIAAHGATLAATHVGITQKSDNITASGATIPNYMRIK